MDKPINFKWIHIISIIGMIVCQIALLFDFAMTFAEYISFLLGKIIAITTMIAFSFFSYLELKAIMRTKMHWSLKVFIVFLFVIGALMMIYFVPQLIKEESDVLI